MKSFLIGLAILGSMLPGGLSGQVRAAEGRQGKILGAALATGFPELVAFQLTFLGFKNFTLGGAIGILPVNSFLNARVPLSPIPMEFSSGGPYNLYPFANYSLTSQSLFARWHPWDAGFFTHLGYTNLAARGSFRGDIKNESSGGVSSSAMTGDLQLNQPVVDLQVGYEFFVTRGLFINMGLGVSYLPKSRYSISLGGTAANVAPLDPQAEQAFEDAKAELRSQAESGLNQLQDKVTVLPTVFLGIGWAFDAH